MERREIIEPYGGLRLDQALAGLFPEFSRSRLKQWVLEGQVRLRGEVVTEPKRKVQLGEAVELTLPLSPVSEDRP
ncbi:MAG: hypothetical protein J4A00_05865, partial [Gammaproteobacteria bacterium]|nr:hypothetical protein [Gammaproteobacteria bacterium]